MFSLVFQALINMLVSVGVLPVTGQTLPLISMGGTSILFTCITIGIILSVSNDSTDREYETA
jgi:cell division protein FtsW